MILKWTDHLTYWTAQGDTCTYLINKPLGHSYGLTAIGTKDGKVTGLGSYKTLQGAARHAQLQEGK